MHDTEIEIVAEFNHNIDKTNMIIEVCEGRVVPVAKLHIENGDLPPSVFFAKKVDRVVIMRLFIMDTSTDAKKHQSVLLTKEMAKRSGSDAVVMVLDSFLYELPVETHSRLIEQGIDFKKLPPEKRMEHVERKDGIIISADFAHTPARWMYSATYKRADGGVIWGDPSQSMYNNDSGSVTSGLMTNIFDHEKNPQPSSVRSEYSGEVGPN